MKDGDMGQFVHPYIPNSDPNIQAEMLAEVGASSVEEFYADVPEDLRVKGLLDLPAPFLAESDLQRHVSGTIARNTPPRVSFLGGGTYGHHVPAVVDEVINRSEFLTAYAGEPYEDHGRFQALFEYQSLMAELLAMDVVNVPTYDGFQAAATALAMAGRATQRRGVVVVSDVPDDMLSRVQDFVRPHLDLVFVPTKDGIADVAAASTVIDADTAAVWAVTPSATGALETGLTHLAQVAHEAGALLVVGTDPIALGVVEPPAVSGADIVHGDIQSLGVHQWFGGGHAGFIAVPDEERLVMEMPSRLFGIAGTAVSGEYGFGDVAYDRTSFAKREEGKEWVGTAGALWGIAAGVYLALMGPDGMRELGETILLRTHYARHQLGALAGVELEDTAAHFREFTLRIPAGVHRVIETGRARGIEPGIALQEDRLLVCVTELTTREDIDQLVDAVKESLS